MKKSNKICNIILIVLTSISFAFFLFYLSLNQIFNAMQCLMLFACMNLPLLIKLIFKYHISITIITIYYLFLIAHFVFGEIIGFYILIKHYDTFLHFSSSFCICYFTFKIIRIYSYKTKVIFCFLIGIASEYIWEIFEFCMDEFFNTNMQRFIQDGLVLTGHLAIFDSIKDMIVALFGCMCFLLVMLIQKEKPLLSKGQ